MSELYMLLTEHTFPTLSSSWPDTPPVSSTIVWVGEGTSLVTGSDEPTAYKIRFVGTYDECCKALKEMNEEMK